LNGDKGKDGTGMAAMLGTVAELEALMENRPDQTRTYQLDPSADDLITFIKSLEPNGPTRFMDSSEMAELARYLGLPVDEFHGTFTVADITCPGCGRRATILDLAKTGVDRGWHTVPELAAVLSGKAGKWVTVRGKDGGRRFDCAECGRESESTFYDYLCDPFGYLYA
jgi:hypothetical protein